MFGGETITLEHVFWMLILQTLVLSFWLGSIRGRQR